MTASVRRKPRKSSHPSSQKKTPQKQRPAISPVVETLARTLYGEARGEPVRGKEAVAAVIVNRVRRAKARGGYWWGNTIEEVCLRPWQFSCWNPGDPNLKKILAATPGNRVFDCCIRIARRAAGGFLADPTDGATHYHAGGFAPPWARDREPSAVIGNHIFYNDVE